MLAPIRRWRTLAAAALRAVLAVWLVVAKAAAEDHCPQCQWTRYRGDVEFAMPRFPSPQGAIGDVDGRWIEPGVESESYEMWDPALGGPVAYPEAYWCWQVLPQGLIYRSYLAGPREPRMGTVWAHDRGEGTLWDSTLGARLGLLRYGDLSAANPQGFQIDIEGAAFPRLDPESDVDLVSTDFRAGLPITWSRGNWRWKTGYYHLSSHIGDEYLLNNPDFERLNYVYDALLLGGSYFPVPMLRLYGEATWAFHYKGGAAPWEFQFGADLSPTRTNGLHGDPFVAINAYLREAVDFGGSLNFQTGWQWRGEGPGHLLRIGLQYFNGKSVQFQFYNQSEEQIGLGVWYDF